MDAVTALWHVLNLFAPAFGVGAIAAALAKLVWWRDLKGTSWLRMAAAAAAGSALVLVGGLAVFGHDGKVVTYAAMVGVCALALWWVGFRPWRR